MAWRDIQWLPVDMSFWDVDDDVDEPLGTKVKNWVELPGEGSWLFKEVRVVDGVARGEDWAEWISAQLACVLGVPHAQVRPALRGDQRGILSKNLVIIEESEMLVHGNQLLIQSNPNYDGSSKRHNAGYTPLAVRDALQSVAPPRTWDGPDTDAYGVWAGYLLFDAWVAGRDRHHENWGVIESPRGTKLAESYDHGNSLGFQESPSKCGSLTASDTAMMKWLERGASHHFRGRPQLTQLAHAALELAQPDVRAYWMDRMMRITFDAVEAIVEAVPEDVMSVESHRFVLKLLRENQRRLINAH